MFRMDLRRLWAACVVSGGVACAGVGCAGVGGAVNSSASPEASATSRLDDPQGPGSGDSEPGDSEPGDSEPGDSELSSGAEGSANGPARAPRLAATSLPSGIEPLSDDERKELESACKRLMDAVVSKASADKQHPDRTEAVLHALQSPPPVSGVDVPKCSAIIKRQLAGYRAKSIEAEAIINLKRIVVGLADATQEAPAQLCPSAAPVPADIEVLRKGQHQQPPSAWSAPGWQCVRFQLGGAPQRFQYEIVTDLAAGTYRLIARGFPVEGHGPEELFLAGKTVDGRVVPSSEVMRR